MKAQPGTRWWIWLLAGLLSSCSQPPSPPTPPATEAEVPAPAERIARVESGLVVMAENGEPQWETTASLAERMAEYGVPGVGIAVIDDFEIAWARGYGSRKAGEDDPVTVETLFHAGSVAKSVSAAAALALVERGRLDLDGDVNQSLVSWRVPASDHTAEEKVTLRRLLSHSAGLEDGMTNRSAEDAMPAYVTPAGVAPSVTLVELLDAATGVDVDGPTRVTAVPGSRYRYANADFVLVELLLSDVTGEPLDSFMGGTVLSPLGMASSTFAQPLPAPLRARAAIEHGFDGAPLAGERLHFPMRAAGGLWTTPSDLANFALEIIETHRGRGGRLLSRGMVSEMLSPQIEIDGNPLAAAAGLGLELGGEGEALYFEHTGATWGSTCLLWAYPELGKGSVIMTNSATGSLLRIEILLSLATEYGWPISP